MLLIANKGGDCMKIKTKLRLISLAMLIVAIVFVFCALSCPTLGRTIYVGNFVFGAEQWRVCYGIYAIIMVVVFVISFFVKDKTKKEK